MVYFLNEGRFIPKDDKDIVIYAVLLNAQRLDAERVVGKTFMTTNKFLAYNSTQGVKGSVSRKCSTLYAAKQMCDKPILFYKTAKGNNIIKSDSLPFSYTDHYSYAYIDGSFNDRSEVYGWGGFLDKNGIRHILKGSRKDDYSRYGSVAGELFGVIDTLKKAREIGVSGLIIYYDFDCIYRYLLGSHGSKNDIAMLYKDTVKEAISDGLDLILVKLSSHSGIAGNDIADRLAREAVGLRSVGCLPSGFFKPKCRYRCFPVEFAGKRITADTFISSEVD